MRNSLNTTLAALASSDFLFLLAGLIKMSIELYRRNYGDSRSSYRSLVEDLIALIAYYVRVSSLLPLTYISTLVLYLQLFHAWSIYLTLLVGVWRVLAILYPFRSRNWISGKCAYRSIFGFISFVSLIVLVVNSVSYQITIDEPMSTSENPKYKIVFTDVGKHLLFWVYA